jgi:hypothetical protein
MTDSGIEATTEWNEPINLTWSQELAASWSIFWPSWLASVSLVPLILNGKTLEHLLQNNAGLLVLFAQLTLLLGQGILTFRLTRKNFRSFWIGVLHEGKSLERHLALQEQVRVWLQIIWPQIVFLVGISGLLFWIGNRVPAETARSLNSLGQLFRILVVGPCGIRWAMVASFRGFRLQAYRRKRKIDPQWSSLRNLKNDDLTQ